MVFLLPLLVVLLYFLVRRIWFDKRKVKLPARIEKIELGIIQPDLILPEVKVTYKYYYAKGMYYGSGYALISEFLPDSDYKTGFTAEGIPFLSCGDRVYMTEEHIETFLISQNELVHIYLDPVEPFHSEIAEIYEETLGIKSR